MARLLEFYAHVSEQADKDVAGHLQDMVFNRRGTQGAHGASDEA